tara:strand:+ start:838 stop:1644 length:807 start_codon:yes stop_codon:yes gene_type:complete
MSHCYVVSPSTVKYISPKITEPTFIVFDKCDVSIRDNENAYDTVTAIGGGAVIDCAKILAKNKLIAYPTTAAGSSTSAHSVAWDGVNKLSIPSACEVEVYVNEKYCEGLSGVARLNTRVDVWAHAIDTLYSVRRTTASEQLSYTILDTLKNRLTNVELVELGNLGGELIRMVPTTLLHGCSYPITGNYGVAHGRALGMMVKGVCDMKGLNAMDWFEEEELNSMSFWATDVPSMDKSLLLTEIMAIDKIHDFDMGYEITPSLIAEMMGM